ncbi:MAG: hypothetical protein ACRC0G_13450 [Fusobacteriaceae bacterium]
MKKYTKPLLVNDKRPSKNFVPFMAVASLSVASAAAVGAAIGLARGRDFKTRLATSYLKPILAK